MTGAQRNLSSGSSLRNRSAYSKLCSTCQKINFREIYSASANDLQHHGMAVTKHRKDFDPKCAFCTLVRSVAGVPDHGSLEKEGYHLRAFDALKMLRLRRRKPRINSAPNIVLAVVLGNRFGAAQGNKVLLRKSNLGLSKGVITLVPQTSESLRTGSFDYFGRPVRPLVDYKLLRSWIRECHASGSKFHEKCNFTSPWLPYTFVIDCHSRKIGPLKEGQEYLALSYVWGPQHAQVEGITDGDLLRNKLPLPAPKTIEDAIEVVKGLGERYLWVDRYCISSGHHKHKYIQNMGLVYEGALATLVAVAGKDSESGLPGVSRPRRAPPYVETEFGNLRPTLCHMSHPISRSVWVTRGWTYQEAFLSRRCLFFTDDQVYFACRASTCSESVLQLPLSQSPDPSHEALDPSLMKLESQLDFKITRWKRPELGDHLSEYTSRSLSYDTDGLNAFKGFLAKDVHYSYWGIPFRLYDDSSSHINKNKTLQVRFIAALFWRVRHRDLSRRRPSARRPGFPSWSWASVSCQIQLLEHVDDEYNGSYVQNAKVWIVENSSSSSGAGEGSKLLALDELSQQNHGAHQDQAEEEDAGGGRIIPEYLGNLLRVEIEIARVRLTRCADREGYDFWALLHEDEHVVSSDLSNSDAAGAGTATVADDSIDSVETTIETTKTTTSSTKIGLVKTDLDPYHATGLHPESEVWDVMIPPKRSTRDGSDSDSDSEKAALVGMLLRPLDNGDARIVHHRVGLVHFHTIQILEKNAELKTIDLG